MSFQIYPTTSEKPETCWRCHTLGLPDKGIQPGSRYMVVSVGGEVKGTCCVDCWNRIAEVVKVNPDQVEGEEWKAD